MKLTRQKQKDISIIERELELGLTLDSFRFPAKSEEERSYDIPILYESRFSYSFAEAIDIIKLIKKETPLIMRPLLLTLSPVLLIGLPIMSYATASLNKDSLTGCYLLRRSD